jgi:hypothetical protein
MRRLLSFFLSSSSSFVLCSFLTSSYHRICWYPQLIVVCSISHEVTRNGEDNKGIINWCKWSSKEKNERQSCKRIWP